MRQIHMIIRERTKMNELPKEIPINTEESNLGNRQLEHEQEKRMSVLNCLLEHLIAGSLEAAYSLNWDAREIWGKGGGETLALLW